MNAYIVDLTKWNEHYTHHVLKEIEAENLEQAEQIAEELAEKLSRFEGEYEVELVY